MASKTTLNVKNLEALGVERLAELLIEISTGSAAHKRRLRLELAGTGNGDEVVREVRKRLSSISRSRTFVDWRKIKTLRNDLQTLRSTIVNTIAPNDPDEALELMWQFQALADSIFERCSDGSGTIIAIFRDACMDLGTIAARSAGTDGKDLAERAFRSLRDNGYGQFDNLIATLAPALGSTGLDRLKALFMASANEPVEGAREKERKVTGWSSQGSIHEDEIPGRRRDIAVQVALQEIADVQGDVDGYIAQQSAASLAVPTVAAEVSRRLLAAGRMQEALEAVERVDITERRDIPYAWQQARIDALDALERTEEAQAFRWQCFERALDDRHLRAFLKRLPDFDDLEAEERAFAFAQSVPNAHQALRFFISWATPSEVARLVLRRGKELDGDLYDLLTPAAEVLAEKHPLAATIVLRSMVEFTLERARATRYKHAARHLAECATLARHVADFGEFPAHDAYVADIRRRHGKKHGFWSLVD